MKKPTTKVVANEVNKALADASRPATMAPPERVPEEAQALIDILAKQASDARNQLALKEARCVVLARQVVRLTEELAKLKKAE